jgi:hypothetical protein
MIVLTIYIIWILFAVASGWYEGFYWHMVSKGQIIKTGREHFIWTVFRGIIATPLVCWLFVEYSYSGLIGIISLMCMFPFFHDGMYYTRRNLLDSRVYPLRWKDTSTTSTAKTPTLDYRMRLVLTTIFLFISTVLILKLK